MFFFSKEFFYIGMLGGGGIKRGKNRRIHRHKAKTKLSEQKGVKCLEWQFISITDVNYKYRV